MRLNYNDIVTPDEAESVDSPDKKLGDLLVNQKLRLTTAEFCTGGELVSAIKGRRCPSFLPWVASPLLMKPSKKSYAYNATALPNIPPAKRRY